MANRLKIVLVGIAILFFFILFIPLPNPLMDAPRTTTLYDKNGALLSAAIATDEQWRFPPSDSIPAKFKAAITLYEDEYFAYHPGINPVALVRAIYQNIKAGKVVSGGSTLTMQTIRLAYNNPARTYLQKLWEMLRAIKAEILYSKEEILKTYADNAPFGGNIVGLSAASYRYFGRPPHRLSWAETATLAVLPNSPALIYPGKNNAALRAKRDQLLTKLASRGYLSTDDLFLAKQEPLPGKAQPLPHSAYHLLHRYMANGHTGKAIKTTLDAGLQQQITHLVNAHSQSWAGNQVHNAAAMVVDINTGQVVAYVGNADVSPTHGSHVDMITAQRSPGSLLKPVLYACALDEGLITPQQLLPDIPLYYRGFSPKNFDKKFRGAVPAHQALASSLNVPFVHLLIKYGYEKFHQKLKSMGLHSMAYPASHYGLSLILGGAETTLDELTALYAGMARAFQNTVFRPHDTPYSPNDYHPNRTSAVTEVNQPQLTQHGLLEAASIGFAFRAMQQLNRPNQEAGWQQFSNPKRIAWKTGTSYGLRDAWAIGVTNTYVIGVWVGNADGEGRPGLTGVQAAAPLMFKILNLLPGTTQFNQPVGMPYKVCRQSGMLAGPYCTQTVTQSLPVYLANTQTCTYHHLLHLNKTKTAQVNSRCYPVAQLQQEPWFILPPVQAWYYKKHHPAYQKPPPFAKGCVQTKTTTSFELIYPTQFAKIYIPKEQDGSRGYAIFEAAHQQPTATLYWHIDNTYVGLTKGYHQMKIIAGKGKHLLTLIDSNGNELKRSFEIIN